MQLKAAEAEQGGDNHFGPENNRFSELEALFCDYASTGIGIGEGRNYLQDADEATPCRQAPGTFTPWERCAG